MNKQLLDEIIVRMELEGFIIHGISCDMGNGTLFKELGIVREKKFWFHNPSDKQRKVYVFPDAPHMLKLARNHLFDNGFMIPQSDGKKIIDGPLVDFGKQDIEQLLEKTELKTLFKLTSFHLDCKSSERQRVRPAAQVLSHSVSKAMMYGVSTQDPTYNDRLAKSYAIKLFNDWFDVMNSRSVSDFTNRLKTPMGRSQEVLADQMDVLNRMEEFLSKFKVKSSGSQRWEIGILTSIKSTKMLLKELVIEGPFDYLLTTRLNQDCLENFFSRLRAIGGDNDHPGPVRAFKRIKTLLVSKQAELIVKKPAVEMEEDYCDPDETEDVSLDVSFDLSKAKFHGLDISRYVVRELDVTTDDPNNVPINPILEEEYPILPEDDPVRLREWDKSHQGLIWIAGRIARKFMDIHPDLGKKTSDYRPYEDVGESTWLFTVSKGGLIDPSVEFMTDCEKFEEMFLNFHGPTDVYRGDRVFDKLFEIIKDTFEEKYDDKVYMFFAKARTYIRMTWMSVEVKSEKPSKTARAHRQMGQIMS